MLTAKFIRENKDAIIDTIKRQKKEKELLPILEELLIKDEEWRKLKVQVDNLRSERNKLSEEVNKTKKAGGDIKPIIAKVKEIPEKIRVLEEKMDSLFEKELRPRLRKIPNIMEAGVPYGKGEEDNVEVEKGGKIKEFKFPIKNHVELCESLKLADFEASAKTSGNGFYFLRGDLGLLNQALLRFATEKMIKKSYTYVEPPLMIKKEILDAAMDTEGFEETIYKIEEKSDNNLCLIGTAEHAILGLHSGETFKADELPKKYAGYSMSFRQEIGSHGINEKGLWRTHQFNKLEQFIYCLPEQTNKMYEELYQNSKEILEELELPYRVVEICTGDLAIWKAKSHDFEVYRPTTKSYGEVMSLSNCTIYQAADLDIKYLTRNGERGVVHTLNNTALATSRIMVAILENYQEEDGSITVPKVLVPYMMGKKKIEKQKK